MKNLPENNQRWLKVRIALVGVVMAIACTAVIARAFSLQVLKRTELSQMAENQQVRALNLAPRRGTIYDRAGNELALSAEVQSVFINPRQMRANGVDPKRAASTLAKLLHLDQSMLEKRLRSNRYFAWLKRRITQAEADAVMKTKLPGLALTHEARRFYPNMSLAAHILGFADIDGRGVEGVELGYDTDLRGSTQSVRAVRDRAGHVIFTSEGIDDVGLSGMDMALTLDKSIQHAAERELEQTVKTFEARAGNVVVLDVQTGEILALANFPTFNPNDPTATPSSDHRNRAWTDRFEPGSTMKAFTVAAALSAGTLQSNDRINCENGSMKISGRTIHDVHPHDQLSLAEVIAFSSNIGSAKIALRLGREELYRAFRRFGFGEVTGLHMPGEVEGTLRDYRSWYDIDTAAVSFGQGIAATPLQMAVAMASIANGGKLLRPQLVLRLTNVAGEVTYEASPIVRRQVVPQNVARLVADMLVAVTGPGGTGEEAAIPGFLVGGKTGTAQKADFERGGYADDKWVSSFIGFLPAESPRWVISVIIDEPVIAHYGGVVAAPVFRRVGSQLLQHYGVQASRPIVRKPEASVATAASAEKIEKNSDTIEASAAEQAQADQIAALNTVPMGNRVPDVRGMSMRKAIVELHKRGMMAVPQGSGRVLTQIPAPGAAVGRKRHVELSLGVQIPEPQVAAETSATTNQSAVAQVAVESNHAAE